MSQLTNDISLMVSLYKCAYDCVRVAGKLCQDWNMIGCLNDILLRLVCGIAAAGYDSMLCS